MKPHRRELAQQFRFANRTLGLTAEAIIEAYNAEHGTPYTKGFVCGLWRDLRKYEAEHRVIEFPGYQTELPRYDHPPHIYANKPTDIVVVMADIHSPLLNAPFANAMLTQLAYYKKRGCHVSIVLAGDTNDNAVLSRHPKIRIQMSISKQRQLTQAFIRALFAVADVVIVLRGNHDDWFARYMDGKLDAEDFSAWAYAGLDDTKLKVIDDTKAVVHNCGTDWRITHGIQYSTIAGRVANRLSAKFDMNIITHHEHSLAVLRDDFNRHTVIANGMMADYALMSYVNDYDTKHNVMKNAYVVLQDGKFQIMTPYIEWQDWKQYDVDPLKMYEYERQKQLVLTGKLDLTEWIAA